MLDILLIYIFYNLIVIMCNNYGGDVIAKRCGKRSGFVKKKITPKI